MATEGEAPPADDPAGRRAKLNKTLLSLLLPVVAAILVTAFTPVGEKLRGALFPTYKSVRGSVVLEGKPVEGAEVALDGDRRATTDSAGAFALTRVRQGDHTLSIDGLGLRTRKVPFEVSSSSEGTDLKALEVVASVRLAGEGSGGVDLPSNPMVPTFRVAYDVTLWLEGDGEVLGQVARVLYTFPTRVRAKPAVVTTEGNRFCYQFAGSVDLKIGETIEGPVRAAVTFKDGRTLEVSVPGTGPLPAGRRPADCP